MVSNLIMKGWVVNYSSERIIVFCFHTAGFRWDNAKYRWTIPRKERRRESQAADAFISQQELPVYGTYGIINTPWATPFFLTLKKKSIFFFVFPFTKHFIDMLCLLRLAVPHITWNKTFLKNINRNIFYTYKWKKQIKHLFMKLFIYLFFMMS